MALSITVLIIDMDAFFIQGLRLILQQYVISRGMSPFVFLSEYDTRKPDLAFLGPEYWQNTQARHKVLISRRASRRSDYRNHVPVCTCVCSTINRYISISELLKRVELILTRLSLYEHLSECSACRTELTFRERQILKGLHANYSSGQIAKYLGLSPKTVSTHKFRAMIKLGFQYNTDLLHWLKNDRFKKELN